MEEKRYITMRHFDIRKKIVPLDNLEDCLLWFDEQKKHDKTVVRNIGQHNKINLLQSYQKLENITIKNDEMFKDKMQQLSDNSMYDSPFNKHSLTSKYNQLLEENIKNLTAIKTFLEISLLENPITELSQKVHDVSTEVSEQAGLSKHQHTLLTEGLDYSWQWIEGVLKCALIHVKHASSHCQYHSQLHALIKTLQEETSHMTSNDQSDSNSSLYTFRLAEDLRFKEKRMDVLTRRVECLGLQALQVVPIRLRTQNHHHVVSAVVLYAYKTNEIDLKEGDEVDVVDRSDLYKWGVVLKTKLQPNTFDNETSQESENSNVKSFETRNLSNDMRKHKIVYIPSILLVVTGVDEEMQLSVKKMYHEHETMLRSWRRTMEEKFLSCLMNIFKNKYSHVEELLIKTLNTESKQDFYFLLCNIQESLKDLKQPELACEVNEINEKIDYLIELLSQSFEFKSGANPQEHGIRGKVLIIQMNTIRMLIENFKDFADQCNSSLESASKHRLVTGGSFKSIYCFNKSEGFKCQEDMISVESVIKRLDHIIASSGADMMQVKYSEEKLRGLSDEEFLKHIKDLSNFVDDFETHQLDKENEKLKLNYGRNEEINEKIDKLIIGKDFFEHAIGTLSEEESEEEGIKISETEQMYAAESEENKRFVVTSVLDPITKQEISLAQALERRVVDAQKGTFLVDAEKHVHISIAEAMAQNFIKVQSTEVRRSQERKLSVGMVTIRTSHHSSKHRTIITHNDSTVQCVYDLINMKQITWQEALSKNIIENGMFVDTRDQSRHPIQEAEMKGWIKKSRNPSPVPSKVASESVPPPDVIPDVSITYAVKSVLNPVNGRKLDFIDACKEGLIEKNGALYINPLSLKKYPLEEAIALGYIVAEKLKDSKSLPFLQGTLWL